MSTATVATAADPRWMRWTGWIFTVLVVAQLLSSAFFRGTQHSYAVEEIVTSYGYPESAIPLIVFAECALVVLYLIPQTSVLAAIVLTGYLGGAVAIHLRAGNGAFPIVFSLAVGALAWLGLILREPGVLRALWRSA